MFKYSKENAWSANFAAVPITTGWEPVTVIVVKPANGKLRCPPERR